MRLQVLLLLRRCYCQLPGLQRVCQALHRSETLLTVHSLRLSTIGRPSWLLYKQN